MHFPNQTIQILRSLIFHTASLLIKNAYRRKFHQQIIIIDLYVKIHTLRIVLELRDFARTIHIKGVPYAQHRRVSEL